MTAIPPTGTASRRSWRGTGVVASMTVRLVRHIEIAGMTRTCGFDKLYVGSVKVKG